MQILITGAAGFIGRNLALRLTEMGHNVLAATRQTLNAELAEMVSQADAVVHLAGANRPENDEEFESVNDSYTAQLCSLLRNRRGVIPVIASSSIQVDRDTPYGRSKRAAETHLSALAQETGAPVNICRLVNVFGKWCRPNYNSAVATFCYNIARDLPITINDPSAEVRLVYVDDVIDAWIAWLGAPEQGALVTSVEPEYQIKLKDLAGRLRAFRAVREAHIVSETGTGLGRALYSTYVSYLPVGAFAYPVARHGDERGVFAEMLRTENSGQFSFFTAGPGITRGGHYHHTKTEKFLVLKGSARFRFLNMDTGETYTINTTGEESLIVETVPGWSHDITNTGDDELICMLWANELFDRGRPDTITYLLDRSGVE